MTTPSHAAAFVRNDPRVPLHLAPTSLSVGFHSIPLILVCVDCKSGSPSARAFSDHLRHVHNIPTPQAAQRSRLAEEALSFHRTSVSDSPLLSDYLQAPQFLPDPAITLPIKSLPPLQGFTCKLVYFCPLCKLSKGTPKRLRQHMNSVHPPDAPGNPSPTEVDQIIGRGAVRAQSLFSGAKTKYFPVTAEEPIGEMVTVSQVPVGIPDSEEEDPIQSAPVSSPLPMDTTTDSTLDLITPDPNSPSYELHKCAADVLARLTCSSSDLAPGRRSHTELEENDADSGIALRNTFLSITDFDEALDALPLRREKAAQLTGAVTTEDVQATLSTVATCVHLYFQSIAKVVRDVTHGFRQAINLHGTTPFRRVQSVAERRYASHVARLLFFTHQTRDADFSRNEQTSVAIDAFFHELNRTSLHETPGETLSHALHSRLHDAMKSLLLVRLRHVDLLTNLAVRNFVVAATVVASSAPLFAETSPTLRLAEAGDMSHILAALQYAVSVTAIQELRRVAETPLPAAHLNENHQDPAAAIIATVDQDANTAATFIRKTLDVIMRIIKHEEGPISFAVCAIHKQHPCGIIKSHHLSMPLLGTIITNQHKTFDKFFYEHCLLGAELPPDFQRLVLSLRDDPTNRAPGFSFLSSLTHHASWVQANVAHLLHALMNPSSDYLHRTPCVHPTCSFPRRVPTQDEASGLGPSPTSTASSGQDREIQVAGVRMTKTGVLQFLAHCQIIQDSLLAMMHFSSGSPGRATEICTYRLQNGENNIRNIFIGHHSEILFNPGYCKSRAALGYNRAVYRFPDKQTSFRMISYLSVIRPLECEMVRALHGDEAMRTHWTFLFANNGQRFSPARVTKVIRTALQSRSIHISFKDYRQFTSGMVPLICQNKLHSSMNDILAEHTTAGHQQAAHTSSIAHKHYGRTTSLMPDCPAATLTKHRQFSHEWHRHLKLPSFYSDRASSQPLPLQHSQQLQSRVTSLSQHEPQPVFQVHQPKPLLHALNGSTANELQQLQPNPSALKFPNTFAVGSHSNHSIRLDNPPNHILPPLVRPLLSALKKATRSKSAEFMSQTQFAVTATVSASQNNSLVLMPTASGKSMAVLLPAFMEKNIKSTIVVVPLKALVSEYMRRATNFALLASHCANGQGSLEFADLYIFTAEQLSRPSFKELVVRLMDTNRLARVVIDEAHLTAMWQHFRPELKFLRRSLSIIPKSVPRVLLSATVPPCERRIILERHGINTAFLFSMPSQRRNLEFVVHTFSDDSDPGLNTRTPEGSFATAQEVMKMNAVSFLHQHFLDCTNAPKPLPKIYRIIAFALTRQETTSLHKALTAAYAQGSVAHSNQRIAVEPLIYHAGLTKEAREKAHNDWTANEELYDIITTKDLVPSTLFRIMVCTSAFGTGIDVPDVRATVHLGAARSLVDFAQESGRSGRDGHHAFVFVLNSTQYNKSFETSLLKKGNIDENDLAVTNRNEMMNWVLNTTDCRKDALYTAMDGQVSGVCRFDKHAVWCDVCRSMFPSQPTNAPHTPQSSQFHTPDTSRPWDANSQSQSQQHSLPTTPSQSQLPPPHQDQNQNHLEPQRQNQIGATTSTQHNFDEMLLLLEQSAPTNPPPAPPVRRILSFSPQQSSERLLPSASPSMQQAPFPVRPRSLPTASPSLKQVLSGKRPASLPPSGRNSFKSLRTSPSMARQTQPNVPTNPLPSPSPPLSLPFSHFQAIDTESTVHLVTQFLFLTKTTCLLCHASPRRSGTEHPQNDCPFMERSCYACFSTTHFVPSCPVPRKVPLKCYDCRLSHCLGQPLHPTFGQYGRCDLRPMISLAWNLWRMKSFQQQIAENLFPSEILCRFNSVLRDRPARVTEKDLAVIFSDASIESADENNDDMPLTIWLPLAWAIHQGLLQLDCQ